MIPSIYKEMRILLPAYIYGIVPLWDAPTALPLDIVIGQPVLGTGKLSASGLKKD